ncbi:MAG: PadR family transcriptional regulator [Clostridiales bacterium]|nr:PadR family transcriptional regulator [Clostridiales bacterium]
MAISADLIRGHLDAILLRLLMEKDRYGYEIAKEIGLRTEGRLEIKEATLYAAIQRLERNKLIVSYSGQVTHGRARKYYKPTPGGRAYYREKRLEWLAIKDVIDKILEDETSENQTTR